jgi:hypothetical protein
MTDTFKTNAERNAWKARRDATNYCNNFPYSTFMQGLCGLAQAELKTYVFNAAHLQAQHIHQCTVKGCSCPPHLDFQLTEEEEKKQKPQERYIEWQRQQFLQAKKGHILVAIPPKLMTFLREMVENVIDFKGEKNIPLFTSNHGSPEYNAMMEGKA